MSTIERTIFRLGYELSPVILVDGIAKDIPGSMLPIIAITEASNFTLGLLQGDLDIEPDDFFAHFRPLPGSTLVANQIGSYTFANQVIAANAIIAQPLTVSLQMDCPANSQGGYISKLLTISALKTVLDAHSQSGGTFTIATPSYVYSNCILLNLRDVSAGQGKQVQTAWQWDFTQPLVSQAGAAQALSGLMSKINKGLQFTGTPATSGADAVIGSSASGATSSIITGAQNLLGVTSTAVPTPNIVSSAI